MGNIYSTCKSSPYTVNCKQDLSGIVTLTNDPIAIDNIRAEKERIKQKALEITAVPKSAFALRK